MTKSYGSDREFSWTFFYLRTVSWQLKWSEMFSEVCKSLVGRMTAGLPQTAKIVLMLRYVAAAGCFLGQIPAVTGASEYC